MVDVDTSELDGAMKDVTRLGDRIESASESEIDEQVSNLESMIVRFVKKSGLVESGELVGSWSSDSIGDTVWQIRSSAEHALPLEEGIKPHRIPESPGDGPVSFVPESTSEYPDSAVNDDGSVTLDWVMWKPDDPRTAKGYDFVENAQTNWIPLAMMGLSTSIDEAILRSGFRPGGG